MRDFGGRFSLDRLIGFLTWARFSHENCEKLPKKEKAEKWIFVL